MLEVKGLCATALNGRELLDGVSFTLPRGEILGLTGESGCGKTTLVKAIMGFLNAEKVRVEGEILLDGRDLNRAAPKERRAKCGTVIGFIPQNPMTAFDPSRKLGAQMRETFCARLDMDRKAAQAHAVEMLEKVNLVQSGRILLSYPNQLSGGMLQRVALALVLGLSPQYILADEPTSALDEANRDIILELLRGLCGHAGVLLITHDAHLLKRTSRGFMVMDNGKVVEQGDTQQLFNHPVHASTKEFVKGAFARDREGWKWEKF